MSKLNRMEHRLWLTVVEEREDHCVLRLHRWVPERLAAHIGAALAFRSGSTVYQSEADARLLRVEIPYRARQV